MLETHRLRLLHDFAVHGSIAATAAALGYSPSAVSQQLATLEREVGVALLDRGARSAELTDAGQRMARHAATILDAVEAAEADLAAQVGTASGRVVISAIPSAAVALSRSLAAMRGHYPDVEVVVRQAAGPEALARVRARDSDIAVVDDWIGDRMVPRPGLASVRLRHDPLVLAVPVGHPLADGHGPVDLSDVAGAPWICAPAGEPSREAFDRVMSAVGSPPTTLWEFEGLATIATLVSQDVGIALLPRLAVTGPVGDRLATRDLPVTAGRDVTAVTRAASQERPAVRVTLDAMRGADAPAVP